MANEANRSAGSALLWTQLPGTLDLPLSPSEHPRDDVLAAAKHRLAGTDLVTH